MILTRSKTISYSSISLMALYKEFCSKHWKFLNNYKTFIFIITWPQGYEIFLTAPMWRYDGDSQPMPFPFLSCHNIAHEMIISNSFINRNILTWLIDNKKKQSIFTYATMKSLTLQNNILSLLLVVFFFNLLVLL